jgi:hypothetical protein
VEKIPLLFVNKSIIGIFADLPAKLAVEEEEGVVDDAGRVVATVRVIII